MRVVVADESPLVRAGVTALLRQRAHVVVADTGRTEQVPALVAAHDPDALVIDVAMPPTFTNEGLRVAIGVRNRHRRVGVLVLSRSAHAADVLRGAGSTGGVHLPERLRDAAALDRALTRVSGGGLAFEPPPAPLMPVSRRPPSLLQVLTPRERDVLRLMAGGLSNQGIAERLQLTTNTVGTHVQHVLDKLGVPDSPSENRRVLAVLTYLGA
jgi:DNA-binding NarL/FixJ family response regulator